MTTLPLPGHAPSGLGFRPDGSLLIVSTEHRQVLRYDGDTVTTVADLSATRARRTSATWSIDDAGRAYVGSQAREGGVIVRIDPDDTATVVADDLRLPQRHGDHPGRRTLDRRRVDRPPVDRVHHRRGRRASATDGCSPTAWTDRPTASPSTPRAGCGPSMTLAHQFERIVDGGTRHRPHRHRRPHRDRLHARRAGGPHAVPAVEHRRLPRATDRHQAVPPRRRRSSTSPAPVTADPATTDVATRTTNWSTPTTHAARSSPRPTWCAAPGRPPSSTARRSRRCWSARWSAAQPRDDTRLSRVMIDLLGGVPAEGDLWVRAQVRAPRQADRIGQRRDARARSRRRTAAGRPGQRLADCRPSTPPPSCTRRRRRCARWPRPRAATWRRTGTATTSTASTGAG